MRVSQLESKTLARLVTMDVGAPAHIAARALMRPGAGLAVICRTTGHAAGVLSKSDLVRHLADGRPHDTTVAALMTQPFVSCSAHDDIAAALQTMVLRGVQNVPVLDEALRPIGILDARDAMQALIDEDAIQERLLTDYIAGVGYR